MAEESVRESTMLGKRVTVTYDRDLVVTGVLLAFSAMGEIVIKDDLDDVWHCWPRLSMVIADG